MLKTILSYPMQLNYPFILFGWSKGIRKNGKWQHLIDTFYCTEAAPERAQGLVEASSNLTCTTSSTHTHLA